jgi:hypothetical protein
MLVLVAVIMAALVIVPRIGVTDMRVAHNAQDARKTLLQHLSHSAPGAPATQLLFRPDGCRPFPWRG